MRKLLILGLLALASTCVAAPIVYTSTRSVGTGTATISIKTDGTIGTLASGNILDWTIALVNGSDSFTLLGPLSGNNSGVEILGTAFSATATNLIFDFSAGGTQYALFQAPTPGSGQHWYCVETNGCATFAGALETINPRSDGNYVGVARTGSVVIASTNAVPEPSTWMSLTAGLGLLAWKRRGS